MHEEVPHETATGFDPAVFFSDPAFWAFVGLIIFLAIVVIAKAPQGIAKSLDDRAAKITADIKNAEELRLLAEKKLEEAKKRQVEAEAEAVAIIEAARLEAANFAANAKVQLTESIARRQKQAEDRIARAEADALRDVKLAAVETASKAAEAILVEQLSGKAGQDQLASSLSAVEKALAKG